MVQASIITIGDELLIGQVIDTNSAWIAQQLNLAGIRMARRVAVGDVWEEIWKALDEEKKHADIIFITGGLGPTADDITKPLLCEYFGGKMIINEAALENVTDIFSKLNRPIIERNRKQAEVPDNCRVILNKQGTAPGMWFKSDGKSFISMPGVPHEMMGMVTEIMPELVKEYPVTRITHRTLLTAGVGESFLAERVLQFEAQLPSWIKLAYLPNYGGMVRLRLTGSGTNIENGEKKIDSYFDELKLLVNEWLVIAEDISLPQVVGRMVKAAGKKICTAESCTGGYIAHLLTVDAGASAFYDGSVVSYSYPAKEDLLGVDHAVLERSGAVSEEVVCAMAKGALERIGSDLVIAVSGIMGPEGGMPEKPVGTVWIAVGDRDRIITKKFIFRYKRARNIEVTAMNALNFLRRFMLGID